MNHTTIAGKETNLLKKLLDHFAPAVCQIKIFIGIFIFTALLQTDQVTARCGSCEAEYSSLSFELYLAEESLNFLISHVAALNAAITAGMAQIAELEAQIADAESEQEIDRLSNELANLVAEVSPLIQARNGYEPMIDQKVLQVAAIRAQLESMPDPCSHEEVPDFCDVCSNPLESCCCSYCAVCNLRTSECMCCPICTSDSRFCDCSSNPNE